MSSLVRVATKVSLFAALAFAMLASGGCGDANVGSSGDFRVAGGAPSQDPAAAAASGASGGGATAGPPTSTTGANGQSFAIALAQTNVMSELQATTTIAVTITPSGGFNGMVTLSATGLPNGAIGVFAPAIADLSSGPATAMWTITVPSTVTPVPAAVATVSGDGGGGATAAAPLTFGVARTITIDIPQNVEANPTAFGTSPIVIHAGTISGSNPIVVNFINQDSSADHIVHSTNTNNGFFHGDTSKPLTFNTADPPRNVTGAADYPFYMHNENTSIGNTISIMVP